MLNLEPTEVGGRRNTSIPLKYKTAAHSSQQPCGCCHLHSGESYPVLWWSFLFFHLCLPWDKNLFREHWSWLHSTVPISVSPSVPKCSNGLRLIYHFFPMFPSHLNGSKIIEVTTTRNGTWPRFWQNVKWWLKATSGLGCREALTQRQPRNKLLFGSRA